MFWREAGKLKGAHRISLADAFGMALTLREGGLFITADHFFSSVFTTAGERCYASLVMATNIVTTITALEAQAEANLFLSDHLPDRFCADDPRLDEPAKVWRVPVLLAYPIIGPVGQTGEILVSAASGKVLSYTPLDEMRVAASVLIELHRDAIEAPVP